VNVRPALPHDTPSLQFLRQERAVLVQQSDPRLLLPAFEIAAAIEDLHAAVIVGEEDGHIAGYIVGFIKNSPLGTLPTGIGYIAELTLDAHKYHGGLGRVLVRALNEWFRERNVYRKVVYVPRYHAVEQAFWHSVGAKEDPTPLFDRSPALVWMVLQ
jgi:GNAT superfamily N-acetyltransferase